MMQGKPIAYVETAEDNGCFYHENVLSKTDGKVCTVCVPCSVRTAVLGPMKDELRNNKALQRTLSPVICGLYDSSSNIGTKQGSKVGCMNQPGVPQRNDRRRRSSLYEHKLCSQPRQEICLLRSFDPKIA